MARIVYVKIRGRRWKVKFQKGGDTTTYGDCDYESRTITVRQTPEARETLIHEILHACQPDLSEEAVIEIEDAITHSLNVLFPSWKS